LLLILLALIWLVFKTSTEKETQLGT